MDTNKDNQKTNSIIDRLNSLPPQLKDAIFSPENADKMFEIGKRHKLLIDKFGEMAHETGMLMLGVTDPDEFVENLAERLGVDNTTANAIAADINREILAPVREHLRTNVSGKAAAKQEPSAASQPIHKTPSGLPVKKEGAATETPPLQKETGENFQNKNIQKQETTLENLEAELERAMADTPASSRRSEATQNSSPLHVLTQKQPPKPVYKGVDPYREQVDDSLPNVRGKPYQTPAMRNNKTGDQKPELSTITRIPFKREPLASNQPTPTPRPLDEPESFSPPAPIPPAPKPSAPATTPARNMPDKNQESSPRIDKYRENIGAENSKGEKKEALPAFRGMKIPEHPEKDPYKEKIE